VKHHPFEHLLWFVLVVSTIFSEVLVVIDRCIFILLISFLYPLNEVILYNFFFFDELKYRVDTFLVFKRVGLYIFKYLVRWTSFVNCRLENWLLRECSDYRTLPWLFLRCQYLLNNILHNHKHSTPKYIPLKDFYV